MYCHACGQGHRYPRLRIGALVEDVIESIVSLDSRIFRTVWGLTVRPGAVVREYLDGRRIVYIHPFKYMLGTVTLAFIVVPWLTELLAVAETGAQADSEVSLVWAKLFNVAALPLQALLLWLLFWRHRLRWVEHFVLVLFAIGHTFLVQTLLNPLALLAGTTGAVVVSLVPIVWLGWTARGTMGSGWISSLARALLAFVVIQLLLSGTVWLIGLERLT